MKIFLNYLEQIGLKENQNILLHSSFRKIRKNFPNISINQFITSIQQVLTENGSIIIPSFTYCFKKKDNSNEIFDKEKSESKVGAVSEYFRKVSGVIRTSSPTHSFLLWGKVANVVPAENTPSSPLGSGSVMEWIAESLNSFILMIGCDFSSLSFGHYLEIISHVPWYNVSPWDYLNIEPYGVNNRGAQKLTEIPGCSKSFINFEDYLLEQNLIKPIIKNGLSSYLIPVKLLLEEGNFFYKHFPEKLLCIEGTCNACDTRRKKYGIKIENGKF